MSPLAADTRLDRAEAKVDTLQTNLNKVEQGLAVHEAECEGRHTAIALKLTTIDEIVTSLARKSDEHSVAIQAGFTSIIRNGMFGLAVLVALALGFQTKQGEFVLHLIGLL